MFIHKLSLRQNSNVEFPPKANRQERRAAESAWLLTTLTTYNRLHHLSLTPPFFFQQWRIQQLRSICQSCDFHSSTWKKVYSSIKRQKKKKLATPTIIGVFLRGTWLQMY